MGNSMAGHLLAAGYPLHIYTRTKAKAENLIDQGAVWEDTVQAVAEKADLVITIIGTQDDVRQVYLGDEGLIANMKADSYVVDMTTSSPKLAEEIADKAKTKNIHALDAPVSGGDV